MIVFNKTDYLHNYSIKYIFYDLYNIFFLQYKTKKIRQLHKKTPCLSQGVFYKYNNLKNYLLSIGTKSLKG
jgi:hypothetical protein